MSTQVTRILEGADDIQADFTMYERGPIPSIRFGWETTIQWPRADLDQALAQLQEIVEQATKLRRQIVQYVEEHNPGRAAYDAARASLNGTPGTAGVDGDGPVTGPGNPVESAGPSSPQYGIPAAVGGPGLSNDTPTARALHRPGVSSDGGDGDTPPATPVPDAATSHATPPSPHPDNCPRCGSPSSNLHPAVQHEGEVSICADTWHDDPLTAQIRAEVSA